MVIGVYLELSLEGIAFPRPRREPNGARRKLLGKCLIVGRAGVPGWDGALLARSPRGFGWGTNALYRDLVPEKRAVKASGSERLNDDEDDDEHHKKGGNFIPDTVEPGRAGVAVEREILAPASEQVMR